MSLSGKQVVVTGQVHLCDEQINGSRETDK